jgi:sporulation-control protein
MSFFKKVLSKVGIGAAKIDTVLDESEVYPGAELSGIIYIQGGNVEQSIQKIDLDVRCNYMAEVTTTRTDNDGDEYEETTTVERTATLVAYDLPEVFTIAADEKREIPFSIQLPLGSPLTLGRSQTWVETNLDIEYALDKSDKDYVNVAPNQYQLAVLQGLESLGLVCVDAENEAVSRFELPFMQELEFKAQSGEFAGRVDEVEVIFINQADCTKVLLEIDRKARGVSGFFASMFDLDETKVAVEVNDSNLDDVCGLLQQVINHHC